MRLLKLLLLLCVCASDPAIAGPHEDAIAAYDKGDYVTALVLWRPLADNGNTTAQFNLGIMFSNGQGVAQDYTVAAVWFRKAADQGNAGV